MSQMIGVGTSADTVVVADYPVGQKWSRFYLTAAPDPMFPRYRDDCSVYSFQTEFWPGAAGIFTDSGGTMGDIESAVWFETPDVISGHIFRYGFVGITRDQYGSPLGGVSIKLFRTLDDTLQDSQVSDVNGGYILGTPYLDAHYVVSQKAGPPPVAGATVNTLIPST